MLCLWPLNLLVILMVLRFVYDLSLQLLFVVIELILLFRCNCGLIFFNLIVY